MSPFMSPIFVTILCQQKFSSAIFQSEQFKVTIDSVELNMENDWIAIYGPQFHDYREWKVFQYVAFANDIQQNENSHVLSIEINDEGTIISL